MGLGLVAFPLAAVAGSYFLARAIYSAQVRQRQVAAHALVDRLAEQIEAAIAGARPSLASPA
jgi:hypothetical protein